LSASVQNNDSPEKPRFLIVHDFPRPEIETLWRDFLHRVEFPAHYDAPEFFLEPHWTGKCPFAVLAFTESRIIGVLTGIHQGDEVISGLPSRPQINLDQRADVLRATDILAEGLLEEAGRANLITVYSWASTPLPGFQHLGFGVRELEGNVVLDLNAGAQALFDLFAKNRRRDVRLAIRNGIEVSEATSARDLQAYWEVYSTWRKTERKQIHHNQTFANIENTHNLRGNHRRFLARYQGKVIAASGLRFYSGGLIEYSTNCSLDEFIKLVPNDLLVWRSIEWACQQGFKRYSLGGAHPFLRKWGGVVIPIHRYRLDRSLFRRHDLKENLATTARNLVRRMPPSVQGRVRKALGKQEVKSSPETGRK
jgi:hypothetical protein